MPLFFGRMLLAARGRGVALILIIEDEYHLRTGIAEGLRLAGFDVAEAADGDAGYAAILSSRPDLVLCDITMPGLRGDDLLQRLRDEHADLARMPFLFLTALADRASVLAGQQLGADDYLTKPVDLGILTGKIRQRLEQVARWDASYGQALEREKNDVLTALGEQSRLSFLSAAEVLNCISDGVVLLNRGDEPIFLNRRAQQMLRQGDGLALHKGQLVATLPDDNRRLRLALEALKSGLISRTSEHLALARRSGRRPYTIRLCRLNAPSELGAAVGAVTGMFVADPESRSRLSEASLCGLYGFSPAEARVAASLAEGLAADEVAASHGISRNTVHHQLRGIFRKTGTTRQSELISLMLNGNAVETLPVEPQDS